MLIFVKVIYLLSEKIEKGNQLERLITGMYGFILKLFQVKIKLKEN